MDVQPQHLHSPTLSHPHSLHQAFVAGAGVRAAPAARRQVSRRDLAPQRRAIHAVAATAGWHTRLALFPPDTTGSSGGSAATYQWHSSLLAVLLYIQLSSCKPAGVCPRPGAPRVCAGPKGRVHLVRRSGGPGVQGHCLQRDAFQDQGAATGAAGVDRWCFVGSPGMHFVLT